MQRAKQVSGVMLVVITLLVAVGLLGLQLYQWSVRLERQERLRYLSNELGKRMEAAGVLRSAVVNTPNWCGRETELTPRVARDVEDWKGKTAAFIRDELGDLPASRFLIEGDPGVLGPCPQLQFNLRRIEAFQRNLLGVVDNLATYCDRLGPNCPRQDLRAPAAVPDARPRSEGGLQAITGFLLGVLASAIVAIALDRGARPSLVILEDDGGRAQGQNPGNPPHEFFHVRVRNVPPMWPLSSRRPAYACQATLELLADDGNARRLQPIPARWVSQPEPILTIGIGGAVAQILDIARMLAGRRVDIHNHEDQVLSVALKFEGDADCHLFTNESYAFARWQNPAWILPPGRHRFRVTVYYERGRAQRDFWLHNNGATRDDLRIEALAP